MCSRVKEKQSAEIVKLRKEFEQAKEEISNLSRKVNTLLRERYRFKNPGISNSITDEKTVDWRDKLEMEKKIRLAHIQNLADSQSQYQSPKSVNPQSGQTINGRNKMKPIVNGFQMTCVIPDFSRTPPHAVRDVSQMICPYENRTEVVGTLSSKPVPSIRPAPMLYNFHCAPPTTGFIFQDQTYFENVVPSQPNPYVDPTQAPVILGAVLPTASAN